MDNPLEKHLIVSFYSKRRRTGPGHLIKPHKPILRELPIIDPAPRTPLRDLANALCDFKFQGFDSNMRAIHQISRMEMQLVPVEMRIHVLPADSEGRFSQTTSILLSGKQIWKQQVYGDSVLPCLPVTAGRKMSAPATFVVRNGTLKYQDELGDGFMTHDNLAQLPMIIGRDIQEFRKWEMMKCFYNFDV